MISHNRLKEYPFAPRIINSVKLKQAALFAADAQVRESKKILEKEMPWLKAEILYDPQAVLNDRAPEPCVFLFDDTALAMVDAEKIRAGNKDAVLVLISFQPFVHCSPPQVAAQKYPYTAKADLVFAASRDEFAPQKILPAIVRAAEDWLNIKKESDIRRYIFYIVDDEPRWFSQFLPVLYNIIGQRADVMISRTFEESLAFLFDVKEESQIDSKNYLSRGRGDDVVCLITDIFFPRGQELQSQAGRDLIRLVNRYYPRIPVIIASKAEEAHELKDSGFIMPKGDPGSLAKLKQYILDLTGLGDFLILDQDGGEIHRAKDIHGFCRLLEAAATDTPQGTHLREILESYGEKDRFSTWLYMHGYRELGDRLRPLRKRGRPLVTLLKRNFQAEMARMERTPLIIDGQKIFSLADLQASLRTLSPDQIQPFSDNDIISSWLDRKGCPELAEALRPIHGSGPKLGQTLAQIIEEWIGIYQSRGL
jgi:hypothetical protein